MDKERLLGVRLHISLHILIQIIAFVGVCIAGTGESEQESAREERERGSWVQSQFSCARLDKLFVELLHSQSLK